MLNLSELERRIDKALEKETSESLTNWLMSKRSSDIETYIGEGDYCIIDKYIETYIYDLDNYCCIMEVDYCSKENQDNPLITSYEMAA